jgi:hypothetical protein
MPKLHEVVRNWNSLDLMDCNGSFRACRDARNFGIRSITTKMVKEGLESTLIAEIAPIEMPKNGNLRALLFIRLHVAIPLRTRMPLTHVAPDWSCDAR